MAAETLTFWIIVVAADGRGEENCHWETDCRFFFAVLLDETRDV